MNSSGELKNRKYRIKMELRGTVLGYRIKSWRVIRKDALCNYKQNVPFLPKSYISFWKCFNFQFSDDVRWSVDTCTLTQTPICYVNILIHFDIQLENFNSKTWFGILSTPMFLHTSNKFHQNPISDGEAAYLGDRTWRRYRRCCVCGVPRNFRVKRTAIPRNEECRVNIYMNWCSQNPLSDAGKRQRGRAMARWPLAAEAQFRSQARSCGICGQVALG